MQAPTQAGSLQVAGQSEASFWYPAVTDDELATPVVLVTNYRQSMALTRRLYLVGGAAAAVWLIDFIRFGSRKGKR